MAVRFTSRIMRRLHATRAAPAAFEVPVLSRHVVTTIPTAHGSFDVAAYAWSADNTPKDHLALVYGDLSKAGDEGVLCRVHSECLTGEVLGSRLCDCGEQLDRSMAQVAAAGRGVILYLRQEGRGIGLVEKLRAYNLQRQGYDTVEANRLLGHGDDDRDFSVAAAMLEDLGVAKVRLITNNPGKIQALREGGVDVAERVPLLPIDVSEHNAGYLATKAERMGHLLENKETAAGGAGANEARRAQAKGGASRPVVAVDRAVRTTPTLRPFMPRFAAVPAASAK